MVENIKVNDRVLSRSSSGEIVVGTVIAKRESLSASHFSIFLDEMQKELAVTSEHPVSCDGSWIPAKDICLGDDAQTLMGNRRIARIERNIGIVRVYDIEVSPHANFYANGVLVHNKSLAAPPTEGSLIGRWFGQSRHGTEPFYLAEFRQGGTGLLATRTKGQEPKVYEIVAWELRGFDLSCRLQEAARKSEAPELHVKGAFKWSRLELEFCEPQSISSKYRQFELKRANTFAENYDYLNQVLNSQKRQ